MRKGVLLVTAIALAMLFAAAATWTQGEARAAGNDTAPPTVTRTVPAARATCVDPAANVSAFFSEGMKASSINDATVGLYRKDSATRVAATVGYGATRGRAIIDPSDPLEGGVTYRALVTTYVKDLAGNRLDQDSARTGLQRKAWSFTATDSETILTCQQTAAQIDLRNAAEAANACAAATTDGSYANCATVDQLQPYGFNPTVGVTVNGMNGNAFDWAAAMQHTSGGSAYTFATFGNNAGEVIQAPRGTSAPTLPDRIAEWEGLAQIDLRNLATAASAYAADQPDGSYTGMTVAVLEVDYGFVPSQGVTTQLAVVAGGTQFVAQSEHSLGGNAFQYDSATGEITPVQISTKVNKQHGLYVD